LLARRGDEARVSAPTEARTEPRSANDDDRGPKEVRNFQFRLSRSRNAASDFEGLAGGGWQLGTAPTPRALAMTPI
jgi:hypothetical protein